MIVMFLFYLHVVEKTFIAVFIRNTPSMLLYIIANPSQGRIQEFLIVGSQGFTENVKQIEVEFLEVDGSSYY